MHYGSALRSYAVPFPGADASIVRRTQRALVAAGSAAAAGAPVVDYAAYVTLPSRWAVLCMAVMGTVFGALASWRWGRALLLAWPRVFTLGHFSHRGPTLRQRLDTFFSMTFFGELLLI